MNLYPSNRNGFLIGQSWVCFLFIDWTPCVLLLGDWKDTFQSDQFLTLSNSDTFQSQHFLTLSCSDTFQSKQVLTHSNSDTFQTEQFLTLSDFETFQFWHFPILLKMGKKWILTLSNSDTFQSPLLFSPSLFQMTALLFPSHACCWSTITHLDPAESRRWFAKKKADCSISKSGCIENKESGVRVPAGALLISSIVTLKKMHIFVGTAKLEVPRLRRYFRLSTNRRQRLMSRWKYQYSCDRWSQASWAQPVSRWVKLSEEWWVLL